MSSGDSRQVTISLETRRVSGLLETPAAARACCVLAHGAGAGMTHPFMASLASGFARRQIATLRYQFPYMEQGSKRPDSPRIAHEAVLAAVLEAGRLVPKLALFAGGKSFGARMSSQAQAALSLPGVRGLVFFGFPLHPPGRVSDERAEHLARVQIPMLFLQGTRDEFAEISLLEKVVQGLGQRATLKLFQHADHSFHVPARTGQKDSEVRETILDAASNWLHLVLSGGPEAAVKSAAAAPAHFER